jgi:hypothetical protein
MRLARVNKATCGTTKRNDLIAHYGWDGLADELMSKYSIKKPKTNRYPSLNGTDPKFRRNHRYALHGTMRALVSNSNP